MKFFNRIIENYIDDNITEFDYEFYIENKILSIWLIIENIFTNKYNIHNSKLYDLFLNYELSETELIKIVSILFDRSDISVNTELSKIEIERLNNLIKLFDNIIFELSNKSIIV